MKITDPQLISIPQPQSWSKPIVNELPPPFPFPEYPVHNSICSVNAYTIISKTIEDALDSKGNRVKLITLKTKESDGADRTYEYVKRAFFPAMPRDQRELITVIKT